MALQFVERDGRIFMIFEAGLSASAREDVDAALKQLSAKWPNLVADLPEAAQEFGLTACDQLAAGG